MQTTLVERLKERFGAAILAEQATQDGVATLWVSPDHVKEMLGYLKRDIEQPYRMLYDLFGVDERVRAVRNGCPRSDFTIVYDLLSFDRNEDIRLKVPLQGDQPALDTITDLWPMADWYECEAWDMFGVRFNGHPHLRRLLTPATWEGHPLRKDHPARATEMGPYVLPDAKQDAEQEALRFRPQDWGLQEHAEGFDYMFMNLGPQHPGTHGVLRLVLQLSDEIIVDLVPDIGFHHRGAEKMGERQSWHTYIPYTDRVDYLAGVNNNLAYLLSVEQLAGIVVPDRARVIRIMMCELFRIASHLVWYGTFGQDLGAMSPVFYMFNDRERVFGIVEAVTGGRMHPNWFRIGGVAEDLPKGWDGLVREFIRYFPPRLDEYEKVLLKNLIFKKRTVGVGAYTVEQAIEWGVTGPNLRACGMNWDFRKRRPYSGYDQFEFEIPVQFHGDCYDRALVRVAELRQSLRIVEQCLKNMPEGAHKSDHPLTTPPLRNYTMHDIETLITHFLGVSWGPVIPAGEAAIPVEMPKGATSYFLISDGNTISYRTRIRTPSFPHLQMLPEICRGLMIPDLLAILGAMDYVLADVDR
ncbi:MAG: NADH-quinone oxidoreductase subunit C/D [Candidatus Hydrogenedentes bacterium]|nr:NADH-quinone oxidoreductase subunit C/D [Candidatus Hydrogenedentota bacterium]